MRSRLLVRFGVGVAAGEQVLRDRQDVADRHPLHERRDEGVVDEHDAVDAPVDEGLRERVGHRLGIGVRRPLAEARPGLGNLEPPEPQRRGRLLARREVEDLLARRFCLPLHRERAAEHLSVERSRKTSVGGHGDERNRLDRVAALEQRQPNRAGRLRHAGHQLEHPVGVRPHRLDPHLSPAQARGGDELHRARQLAGVRDRADAPLEVLDRGHRARRRLPPRWAGSEP